MKAVKFTFDTSFDGAQAASPAGVKRARRSYGPDEIDALINAARDEGRKDGSVRAQATIASAVGQLAAALFQVIKAMDEEAEAIRAQATDIALLAATKLAGAALAAYPQEAVYEALREALAQAIGEPRVTFKVSPMLASEIGARVAEIAAEEGFEGRVAIAADPSLALADCRLEWRGGGIEHSTQIIETALADLIARRFGPRDASVNQE